MIEVPLTVEVIMIQSDFKITAPSFMTSLAKDLDSKVEMAWQMEKDKRRGQVFDGNMLSLVSMEPGLLTGEYVPYKTYVAQLIDSHLREKLAICPVGVSGIVISPNSVLFGERSSVVTLYPNFYELAPSGSISIDSLGIDGVVDYRMQLLVELFEETRISPDKPTEISPFALAKDTSNLTVDICCLLRVKEELSLQFNDEYPSLAWVPFQEVGAFVNEHSTKIVPTSLAILSVAEERGWI
ncbi:MAG: hypothetical protein ACI8RA_000929 [Chlamydiales bacterium]|jgi:hypothetical protein